MRTLKATKTVGALVLGLFTVLCSTHRVMAEMLPSTTLMEDEPASLHREMLSPYLSMSSSWLTVAGVSRGHGRYTLAQASAGSPGGAAPPANAEAGMFANADEAARQSSNPLGGAFFVLLNQIDNIFLDGDATDELQTVNSWAFQPVIPISLEKAFGKHWIWVNRPTFPFILHANVPDVDRISGLIGGSLPTIPDNFPGTFPAGGLPFTSASGFGDIVYFSLVGRSLPQQRWGGGDLVWAIGLTNQFPTASDDALGSGKYSIGPSGVLSFIGRKFILGGLYQQWLSYASGGNGSGEDVNFSWLNVFYFLNFPGGWQVGGTPVVTADWEADSDNRWTVPIGVGVYKTQIFFGKMPMKFGIELQYMPIRPDALGQVFNIRLVVAPVVPSLFKKGPPGA